MMQNETDRQGVDGGRQGEGTGRVCMVRNVNADTQVRNGRFMLGKRLADRMPRSFTFHQLQLLVEVAFHITSTRTTLVFKREQNMRKNNYSGIFSSDLLLLYKRIREWPE